MGRVCMVRDLVAELVMGRVFYGPSLSWAEFVMGRDVPESKKDTYTCPTWAWVPSTIHPYLLRSFGRIRSGYSF